MKYPFIEIECQCCETKMMQGQLEAIRPFNENKYQCYKCETEIKLITKIKYHEK